MTLLMLLCFAAGPRVPDGFVIDLVADHAVANDVHCLTLTPDGRVVVSGRGYVRVLDGTKATDFAGAPKDGAMGLCHDGGDLYAVGDGGLWRWPGADPGRKPEMVYKLRTGSEHSAHAVMRGPDGWMYLMTGDNNAVTAKDLAPTSLVKDPVGGCVLRFSPDWKRVEVFAHGFRNAYGMDFAADGGLYTYDSDNERCVGLPWYEPTRVYRVAPGGHHGWLGPKLAATWRLPPYFPDVVKPVATLGRGSPTGVVVYKHASFPERYRGGAFALDWTFGVIHFVPLGGGKPEVFLKAAGGDGFAPTAAAVHPVSGDLYVSVGGRGTRGGVYRISHPEGRKSLDPSKVAKVRPSADRPAAPLEPSADPGPLTTLLAVRRLQLWLGGPPAPSARGTVWEGYTRAGTAVPDAARRSLRRAFPSGDATLDVELSRTLAMIEDDDTAVTCAAVAKLGAKSATDDVHYLAVLGRLRGPLDAAPVADALLTLESRLGVRPDTNWPLRLAEIHAALAARSPGLNAALVTHPAFGRPEHAVFTRAAGFDRAAAAERFLKRAEGEFAWTDELVRLVAGLPPGRSLPVLRKLWGTAGIDDAILPALAKAPAAEDRPRLLSGLTSARVGLVRSALGGLEKLPPDRSEALELVRALTQVPPEEDALKRQLTARLEAATGRKEADWLAWARRTYPERAAALADADGVDAAAWAKRAAAIDWTMGDAKRGEAAFVKASCAACHSGAAALGPDLAGVGKRFGRQDLLTAIVRPSKDVSERYRTTRVITGRGVVHVGVIVYEAVDGLILQTGPGETVRVPGVPEKTPSPRSLMPAGLLDRLTDAEVADLMAHLAGR